MGRLCVPICVSVISSSKTIEQVSVKFDIGSEHLEFSGKFSFVLY